MATLRITVRSVAGLAVTRAVDVDVIRPVVPSVERRRPASAGRRVRLGQILLEAGVIDQAQLQEALQTQQRTGERLGVIVHHMGLGSQEAIASALAQQVGIKFVRVDARRLNEALMLRVPEPIARRHQIIPLEETENTILLGMVDPLDVLAIDDAARLTGINIEPAVITLDDCQRALSQYPTPDGSMDAVLQQIVPPGETEEGGEGLAALAEDAPIVRLANLILVQAVRQGASDVHIEPQERRVRVRFRVDGAMRQVMTPPRHVHAALVSRIKIMANMNIAERRVPQDGRVDLRIDTREIRLRVSTVPTTWGEKAVMRILDRSNAAVEIGRLGMRPDDSRRFEAMIRRPHGVVLFTGPTGSGKTTSLYAVLNRLNSPDRNIVTIEDPVEYQIGGISQVQVHPRAGLTFASGLRAFLRQDPDIIMVGEIRDEETARIAVHAALTGHLVLSTLHTNDSPSAVSRLVDMGVEPFLVSSSVIGVVAQRLVRRLCEKCREAYTPTEDLLRRLGLTGLFEVPTFYKPRGCEFCGGSGYRGRVGLFEVMGVDETVRGLIAENATPSQIRRAGLAAGMRTLQDDGLVKVAAGMTSLEELRRVVFMQEAAAKEALVGAVE